MKYQIFKPIGKNKLSQQKIFTTAVGQNGERLIPIEMSEGRILANE